MIKIIPQPDFLTVQVRFFLKIKWALKHFEIIVIISIYLNVECTCNVDGTIGTSNICDKVNGRCNIAPGCKKQYAGDHCSLCNIDLDYYGVFPNCKGG